MSLAFHGRERNIPLDVALLRSLNILVVLVHGAAEQIKALSEKQSIEASHLEATGVTDATTLQLAIDVANRLTHEIWKAFQPAPPAVHLFVAERQLDRPRSVEFGSGLRDGIFLMCSAYCQTHAVQSAAQAGVSLPLRE